MKSTKMKIKTIGKAEQCIDCEAYLEPNRKVMFETVRKNPDYKKGSDPLYKMMKSFPQCENCGYDKFC
jgi:hypothetical protein